MHEVFGRQRLVRRVAFGPFGADDEPVAWPEALLDCLEAVELAGELDTAGFDDVFLIDDQHVEVALGVRHHGAPGDHQDLVGVADEHAQARGLWVDGASAE